MKLQPRRPPGHGRRKLLDYVPEIERLRAEGYSIAAIHEALQDAGVDVGWGAVRREVARLSPTGPSASSAAPVPSPQLQAQAATPQPAPASPAATFEPGEPIPETVNQMSDVEAFFAQHISNPVLRRKGLS